MRLHILQRHTTYSVFYFQVSAYSATNTRLEKASSVSTWHLATVDWTSMRSSGATSLHISTILKPLMNLIQQSQIR